MSTLALWTMEKTVTLGGELRHLHKGALIARPDLACIDQGLSLTVDCTRRARM